MYRRSRYGRFERVRFLRIFWSFLFKRKPVPSRPWCAKHPPERAETSLPADRSANGGTCPPGGGPIAQARAPASTSRRRISKQIQIDEVVTRIQLGSTRCGSLLEGRDGDSCLRRKQGPLRAIATDNGDEKSDRGHGERRYLIFRAQKSHREREPGAKRSVPMHRHL